MPASPRPPTRKAEGEELDIEIAALMALYEAVSPGTLDAMAKAEASA